MTGPCSPRECVDTLRRAYKQAREAGLDDPSAAFQVGKRFGIEPSKVAYFCKESAHG